MAIQTPNFLGHGEKPRDYSGISNLLQNALSGYKISQEPAAMGRKAESEELANALQQMALDHKPREMELKDALMEAQTQAAQRKSELGGVTPTGSLANFIASNPNATREQIQNEYKRLQNLEEDYKRARIERSDVLNQSQGTRGATQTTKMLQEIADAEAGFAPGTMRKETMSPEKRDETINRLHQKMYKEVTDPKTRERLGYAKNVDITLNNMSPSALTRYAGVDGKKELIKQKALAAQNKPTSPEYQEYLKNQQLAKLLSKQVRQFYGDSIQPKSMQTIEKLASPDFWFTKPDQAELLFNTFANTLRQEANTFYEQMNNANFYRQSANNEVSNGLQSNSSSRRVYDLSTRSFK